ncbi:hypothetical protein [Pseudoxanthomonas wuyuanensis]
MFSSLIARLLAPAVLATGLGIAAFAPAPARASDDLVRVIVDVADVIYHGGSPYYRHGRGYYPDNRVVIVRDRYHRPTYYRYVPRTVYYAAPPYGRAHGYYRNAPRYDYRHVRYDDHRYDHRYDRHHDWRDDDRRGKKRHHHRDRD